jgi:hypothetical protein
MMMMMLLMMLNIVVVDASLNVSESLNSHSFSSMMRSKWAFDAWDARIRAPRDLEQPRRVLSYGCSVGFELLVLAERFPDAAIVGTDQKFSPHSSLPDASAVYGEARALTAHEPRIKLVPPAQLADEPLFDLITCNFVLYRQLDLREFSDQMQYWFSLLNAPGMIIATHYASEQKNDRATGGPTRFDFRVELEWIAQNVPRAARVRELKPGQRDSSDAHEIYYVAGNNIVQFTYVHGAVAKLRPREPMLPFSRAFQVDNAHDVNTNNVNSTILHVKKFREKNNKE